MDCDRVTADMVELSVVSHNPHQARSQLMVWDLKVLMMLNITIGKSKFLEKEEETATTLTI